MLEKYFVPSGHFKVGLFRLLTFWTLSSLHFQLPHSRRPWRKIWPLGYMDVWIVSGKMAARVQRVKIIIVNHQLRSSKRVWIIYSPVDKGTQRDPMYIIVVSRGFKTLPGWMVSFSLEGYNRNSEINTCVLTGRNGGETIHPGWEEGGAQQMGAAPGQHNATVLKLIHSMNVNEYLQQTIIQKIMIII